MALPLVYNLRSLRVRWRAALLAVGAIALVSAVLVAMSAMADGFRLTLRATGRPDNAVVVQRGSLSELTSWVSLDARNRLVVDARVARGADGQPLASPEIVVVAALPRRSDRAPTNVTVRGVTPRAFDVRGGIHALRGRVFRPGLREVMVGQRIAERIAGLEPGRAVVLQRSAWEVVGVFGSSGGAFESEIWGDLEVMASTFQRSGGSNSLVLRMLDPGRIASFDRDVRAAPSLRLRVQEERAYYEAQSSAVTRPLLALAVFVGVVTGIGAAFGAMNTMYAIVAARSREIGTLRALGFSRRAVLAAFVVEALLLGLTGGLLGCLLALPINALSGATANTAGFAELAWAFRITPRALAVALGAASLMGLCGGLLPALRAARLPIVAALRAK